MPRMDSFAGSTRQSYGSSERKANGMVLLRGFAVRSFGVDHKKNQEDSQTLKNGWQGPLDTDVNPQSDRGIDWSIICKRGGRLSVRVFV